MAHRLRNVQCSNTVFYAVFPLSIKSIYETVKNMYTEPTLYGVQRLKSKIVKQLSHEFRTPLTSILGFAEILEEDVQIDEDQRIEYASYIRNEGLRLTKLINDLVELDSLEQECVDLHLEEYEIQETALYAIMLVADPAHKKFIHISIELPNEPIRIKIDRERIVHVLFQLLHNAVRFTKQNGHIHVKVEISDKHVVISIRDTGPGIPPRDIPFLFQRFGKQYRPSEEAQNGGIGLAIAKKIIDQHSGDISVQSSMGIGSTFTVRIPIL